MKGRLVLSITSTILEEAAIVAIVLWGLPRWNIRIPLWGLIIIMVAWTAYSIFTHRAGSRALKRKQPTGLLNMIGCKGEVISPLAPEGLVRINGELWKARSAAGEMAQGEEITVVGQDRLKLVVQKGSGTESLESKA